jgi:DNA topoisomerase IB
VTTWLWSHTMLKNSYVVFRYVAKSGVVQVKEVSDMESVAFLKAQRDKRTPSVFTASNSQKVSAKMVNAYLQEFGITSKDIRTWNANTLLAKTGASCDNLKAVAQTIGNQPNTLKNNYILPETAKGINCKKKKK